MDEVIQKQSDLRGTVSAFSDRMIRNTNTVRLYLKCTFASDITDITNGLLLDDMIHGTAPRATNKVYPAAQERPSDVAFKDWKHTIYTSFIHGTDGARNVGIPIPQTTPDQRPLYSPISDNPISGRNPMQYKVS